jgi:glutamate/tyrosine decarboxylase-like PLP-dependent enzyme
LGNLAALHTARETALARRGGDRPKRWQLAASVEAHSSVAQAARVLDVDILEVPVDARHHLHGDLLCATIERDGHDGLFGVVASAGAANLGVIDDLAGIADVCAERQLWLHVDGAYGYGYKLVPEWAHHFAGDTRADSISWDPHKQLGAPIPNSLLFLKDGGEFGRMTLHSGYFNRADDVEPNPGLKSPPTTRPFAALPLVTLLRGKGLDQIRADLRAPLVAIRQLADYLPSQPNIELCHQPDTGILCFRVVPTGWTAAAVDKLQRQLYERLMAKGERTIATTTLDGRLVLRLVTVSPHTSFADLRTTIDVLATLI